MLLTKEEMLLTHFPTKIPTRVLHPLRNKTNKKQLYLELEWAFTLHHKARLCYVIMIANRATHYSKYDPWILLARSKS